MTSREIIKRLEEDGWYHVKTTGDHYQMKHPTKPGKVTIVHPAKDFSIGTLQERHDRNTDLIFQFFCHMSGSDTYNIVQFIFCF